jgi:hypothetical protein
MRQRKGAGYVPLETVLASPLARTLRALRHHDAVSLPELWDLLNEPRENRGTYVTALARAHRQGWVDRIDYSGGARLFGLDNGNWYRITQAGRDELARLLTTNVEALGESRRWRNRKRAA